MTDPRAKVAELCEAAERLEDGLLAKADLFEQAVREADALEDAELAYRTRIELLDAACWAGDPKRMIVTLAWCLARLDKTPNPTGVWDVLWRYKWVALELPQFAEVERSRIERLLEDMHERFRAGGFSPRPVCMHRVEAAMRMGDAPAAARWESEFLASSRDRLADCLACEQHHRVMYALWRGDDDAALSAAQPIIAGRSKCAEIPATTLGHLLVPLLRRGEVARAIELHRTGERLVLRRVRHLAETFAQHLVFLTLTGNLSRAVTRLDRYYDAAYAFPSAHARLGLELAGQLVASTLVSRGQKTVRLALGTSAKEPRDTQGLADRFLESARATAAALDARNGNPRASDRIERALELPKLAVEAPLTKKA